MGLKRKDLPDISNFKQLKKLITSHKWEGLVFVDEGWGPLDVSLEEATKQNKCGIREILGEIRKQNSCFFMEHVVDKSLDKDLEKHYKVVFDGNEFSLVNAVIKTIASIGGLKQKWVLDSYYSSEDWTTKKELYRLIIDVIGSEVTAHITKGRLIPDFSTRHSKTIAGWIVK